MCHFPSWIIDSDGQVHWLTDKDIRNSDMADWNDSTGHHAITKILGVKGKHMEGRKGLPKGFAADIRSGRCNRMAQVDLGQTIENVMDLMPPGFKWETDGNLTLYDCTALPEGLKVGGYLNLYGCTALTALPEGLKVGGYLNLYTCISLTALPEGLKVGGWLDLRGCTSLAALPEGLKVGGWLDLSGCTGLTALPEGLKVGGDLYLNDRTGLTALPEGLKVGGKIYR